MFLAALGSTLLSIVAMLPSLRRHVELDRRSFVGGYSTNTRVLINVLESSALVWGCLGLAGTLYLRKGLVKTFFFYQVVRLLAWLVVFYVDTPLLWDCELWRNDPAAAGIKFGENDAMHILAVSGHCNEELPLFLILSLGSLLVFAQLLLASQKLIEELESKPLLEDEVRSFQALSVGARMWPPQFVSPSAAHSHGTARLACWPFGVRTAFQA